MEKIDLSGGGIIIIAYGNPVTIKEFENNPQVKWVDTKLIPNQEIGNHIPVNTRLIILNEGIPHYHYLWLTTHAPKMKIVWLMRKSSQAIYEVLKEYLGSNGNKPSLDEVKDTQAKGKLLALLPFVEWNKSNAENAKILMAKALELGIKTNENSLAQFMSVKRRALGHGGIVKSVRNQLDISVDILDEAIKNLANIRDFLISTSEENRMLKSKAEKLKKVMED